MIWLHYQSLQLHCTDYSRKCYSCYSGNINNPLFIGGILFLFYKRKHPDYTLKDYPETQEQWQVDFEEIEKINKIGKGILIIVI